ncbi:hypothetical protein KY345_00005, partial [Candidatus Woesearchaeota archaeon]|nr:hypothetical protein [Candidatus Woesearchaeota archaeon]
PVFIGMSVIYYFIMGVLMEKTKGIGQPGRIALAVFLGFQAALDGMDMIQVWKLGYGVVLLSVYRISVGQGNWLAFGMAFAIANILGMVARTQTWSLSDSFPWVELGFFKSFITGAIVGFLFDKARKSKMLKWNKDKEDIERERKEAEERWRRQYDLAVKGFMKKIETADPKVIVYLRKDMGELALLVRRKEALPIGSPEWNRVMFGVEGYPTIADYEPRYERLKGARKALVDRTEAEAPTNLKDIKKEAKAVENVSRRIDEEKEALLKGKIIGHQAVTNRNPVYSAKLKTIMGIIMHAELEVRRIMEEQEKEKEVLTGW